MATTAVRQLLPMLGVQETVYAAAYEVHRT